MKIIIHQTLHTIADFDNIFGYLQTQIKTTDNNEVQLHLFPELFLTGYPLQDLCVQKSFFEKYLSFIDKIKIWSRTLPKKTSLLMGGLSYTLKESQIPEKIENVIFEVSDKGMKPIYTKQLLPNYDIFDEQKYFHPGNKSVVWSFQDKKFGLLICEDMWSSSPHDKDPVEELKNFNNSQLDGVINLSASPYIIGKDKKRFSRAQQISNIFKCPFFYVNKVGGEDEILFDGRSFIADGKGTIDLAKSFQADILEVSIDQLTPSYKKPTARSKQNTWDDLFTSNIVNSKGQKPRLALWTDEQCEDVLQALMFGFQQYASKSGFKNFTIALSGGMDSALVLTIIRLSLKHGQYLEAIYMPSIHSSPISWELSSTLCKSLGISLSSLPIKFLHSTAKNLFSQTFPQPFEGITDENIQSRLRGMLLYTRSNQINSMIVNTSNKSEIAVGYSTQYGDSVGAISMLGDLFKSEVYRLAEYINKQNSQLIPEQIISRAPTAELRADQKDSDSLPSYEVLDAILDGILSYRYTAQDLIDEGFNATDVEKVFSLYKRCEYKRYQFCPIIKVSSKSFGFGYRVPISKTSTFYDKDATK